MRTSKPVRDDEKNKLPQAPGAMNVAQKKLTKKEDSGLIKIVAHIDLCPNHFAK